MFSPELTLRQLMVLGDRSAPSNNLGSVAKQTKGICFLSTPFFGSSLADWANGLGRFVQLLQKIGPKIQTKNIKDLTSSSEPLKELNEAFSTVLDKRQIAAADEQPLAIACFYEEYASRGVVVSLISSSASYLI